MKKQFNLRLIGAAFVLLLISTLSSCTVPMGGYDCQILGGGPMIGGCGVGGGPGFMPGNQPCWNGGGQFPGGGWQQHPGWGRGSNLGYQRQPLWPAGQDVYGNRLFSGRSYSGHEYLTSNGYVNAPPIGTQNPRGNLRYVYYNSPDRRSDPSPYGQPAW